MRAVRASVWWAITALGLLPLATRAAEPPAKPVAEEPLDEDLLEFLGTIDSEDEDDDWIDYLTQTDIEKVAARKRAKPAPDATEVKK